MLEYRLIVDFISRTGRSMSRIPSSAEQTDATRKS